MILKVPAIMRPLFRLALVMSVFLMLGANSGRAEDTTNVQRQAIEKIIREYLVSHPEVLQEAIAELEKKQAADEAAKHETAVKDNSPEASRRPRSGRQGARARRRKGSRPRHGAPREGHAER
jgi:hypothetical protein